MSGVSGDRCLIANVSVNDFHPNLDAHLSASKSLATNEDPISQISHFFWPISGT